MKYYVCPYCEPWGRLLVVKAKEARCDHKKGFFDKDKECRKENYKCKEVMECDLCGTHFKKTDKFLAEQKRKIKDG